MSIDSNLPCQKKAPLTPQPKSYSTFPKSLISVHHCLFGLFCSKENWLTCTLRSRSRWVVRHWAAPSEKGGHTGGLDHRRARQGWIVLVFWTILEDSNLVIFSLALTEWPHRDQQIRQSDEPTAEKKTTKPSVIAVSHATICQATLSFQGKSWAQNDIIAWLGEVWTHNPCWTRSHTSVMSRSLRIASRNPKANEWMEGEWTREKKGEKIRTENDSSKAAWRQTRTTQFGDRQQQADENKRLLTNLINCQRLQVPITGNHSPKQQNF